MSKGGFVSFYVRIWSRDRAKPINCRRVKVLKIQPKKRLVEAAFMRISKVLLVKVQFLISTIDFKIKGFCRISYVLRRVKSDHAIDHGFIACKL